MSIKAMFDEYGGLLKTAETANKEDTVTEMLKDPEHVDINVGVDKIKKATVELYGFLARSTTGEAASIVRCVEDMDGLQASGVYTRCTTGRPSDAFFACSESACTLSPQGTWDMSLLAY